MKAAFYTLGTFEFPAEAQMIKAKLEAEGIPVFLRDEATLNSDPLLSAAIGGVKLQVYSADQQQASAIFSQLRQYATGPNGKPIVCPNCKATQSERYYTRKGVFYQLFPFFEVPKYRCMRCTFITKPEL